MPNRIITAAVTGETIKLSNKTAGAAGSFNAVSLSLTFDSAWDGTTKKLYFLTGLLLCCMLTNASPLKKNNGDQFSFTLNSPDKKLRMEFSVTPKGAVFYTFSADKKELIGKSELGLKSGNNTAFQWTVLDYKLFTPGQTLPDGALWISEQVP